jgi:hypothetical protein
MANKSIFVQAYFKPPYQIVQKKWFGLSERKIKIDSEIDADRLNSDLEIVIKSLNNDGYNIISITPITSARYDMGTIGTDAGWGYGYSFTEGIIVLALKQ